MRSRINQAAERAKQERMSRHPLAVPRPTVIVRYPGKNDQALLSAWRFVSDATLQRMIDKSPPGSDVRTTRERGQRLRRPYDDR